MRWVLLLFVVVPLVELYLLLQLAVLIDFWPTVGLVVVTGLLGGALAKMEGLKVWRAWQKALQTMTPPEQGVLDGVLVLAGGALLITPGVLTDIAGLLMLIPWSRRWIAVRVRRLVDRKISAGHIRVVSASSSPQSPFSTQSPFAAPQAPPPRGDVVETTGEVVDE